MRLHADTAGTGDRTIVLLHGFGGDRLAWLPVVDRLAETSRTIAYDLPGHGLSGDFPEAGPPKVAVRAVLADLAERGVEKAHLVGHSMGGAIATLMALAEPSRVASLTLLAPGGFGPEINMRLLHRFAAARSADEFRAALEGLYGWMSPISEEMIGLCVQSRPDGAISERLTRIAGFLSRDGRQGVIPRDRIAELSMPISLVWGELDNVLPYRQTRDLPPNIALHSLPDVGHMLIDEAPDQVFSVIKRTAR